MIPHLIQILAAFAIVVAMIPAIDPVARRWGLLDQPGGRKDHGHAVPVTGGIAMFTGLSVPMLLLGPPGEVGWGLVTGLSGLVGLGAADDLLDLGPWVKLAGQFAAALAIITLNGHLVGPGELLGLGHLHAPGLDALGLGRPGFSMPGFDVPGLEMPALDLIVSALFVVGLANAFNMLDGLDGLAGGAAAAVLACLAVIAATAGSPGTLVQILLLLAAVLGFLLFNARHPWRASASVFMGDAGSLMLGAAIACFMLDLAACPAAAPPVPALLWLVAVPGFDMAILIVRRRLAGQSPFCGDRRHVHHALLRAGLSPSAAAAALVAACGVLGAAGIALWVARAPGVAVLALLVVPFAAQLHLVLHGWRRVQHLGTAPALPRGAAEEPMATFTARAP